MKISLPWMNLKKRVKDKDKARAKDKDKAKDRAKVVRRNQKWHRPQGILAMSKVRKERNEARRKKMKKVLTLRKSENGREKSAKKKWNIAFSGRMKLLP